MYKRIVVAVLLAAASCEGDAGSTTPDGPGGGGGGDGGNNPGAGEPANLTGITAAHNAVRAMVQTSPALQPMTWNNQLAATAAAWVAMCRDSDGNGLIDHNMGRSMGHPYYVGENVFGGSGNVTAQQAVNLWAGEKANYNYATNSCSGVCGHYTQIVWRTSVELGCAMGTCPSLQYKNVVVCNYGPGGNSGGKPY
jgi:uncharacterized protein YkwD